MYTYAKIQTFCSSFCRPVAVGRVENMLVCIPSLGLLWFFPPPVSFLFGSDLVQGPGRGFRVYEPMSLCAEAMYVWWMNLLVFWEGVIVLFDIALLCWIKWHCHCKWIPALHIFFFGTEVLSKLIGRTWLMGRYWTRLGTQQGVRLASSKEIWHSWQ